MIIDAAGGWHLFVVGLTAGAILLAASAYVWVSPQWLVGLLLASALLALSRYVAMMVFALSLEPSPLWLWSRCYFATAIALTLPGLVAFDQLIRHPAMTPKKLLTLYAPLFAGYVIVLGFGRMVVVPGALIGSQPQLLGMWAAALAALQAVYVAGLLGLGATVLRKLPTPRLRAALGVLMAAYAYLALDGLLSELLAYAAIWFALDTARHSTV